MPYRVHANLHHEARMVNIRPWCTIFTWTCVTLRDRRCIKCASKRRRPQLEPTGGSTNFIMKYYLFLLVVAVCEAGRITRGIIHEPSIQAVYHGHGATSYQSLQVDNHDSIIVPTNYENYGDHADLQDLEDHEYEPIIPVIKNHNDVDHIDISHSAPYEEFTVADVKLKSDILGHYLDHDEEKHNFDFHLRK